MAHFAESVNFFADNASCASVLCKNELIFFIEFVEIDLQSFWAGGNLPQPATAIANIALCKNEVILFVPIDLQRSALR